VLQKVVTDEYCLIKMCSLNLISISSQVVIGLHNLVASYKFLSCYEYKTISTTIAACVKTLYSNCYKYITSVLETTVQLQLAIGHFPTNFNIWLTKIHFGWPILLYTINGMTFNNLHAKCPIFKKMADQFLTLIFTTEPIPLLVRLLGQLGDQGAT